MSVTGYQQQPTVYRYDFKNGDLVPLDSAQDSNGMAGFIVEQLWAESKDGTKVPMTVVRKEGVKLDGSAALKLSAYGGFGSASSPRFEAETLDFLESGGIYAYANIRGGGEFGAEWHDQGRLLNKQNSFDDFIACAKHLIRENYTSSPRFVAEGTSNGGLLVLAAMQQEPALFGAVIANCPVADMFGKEMAVFKGEYGDPFANEDDYKNEKAYSPCQNIKEGMPHPPCLIRGGAHDLLVAGEMKFVAAMQYACPQNATLLHVEMDFGHGSMRPKNVEIEEAACKKSFVERSIGPIDQNAYKRDLSARRAVLLNSGPNA